VQTEAEAYIGSKHAFDSVIPRRRDGESSCAAAEQFAADGFRRVVAHCGAALMVLSKSYFTPEKGNRSLYWPVV